MIVDIATPLWIIAATQAILVALKFGRKRMADEDLKPITDQLDTIETGVAALQADNAKVIADLEALLAGAPGEDNVVVSKAALSAIVGRLAAAGTAVAAVDAADVAADAEAHPAPPPEPTPAPEPTPEPTPTPTPEP